MWSCAQTGIAEKDVIAVRQEACVLVKREGISNVDFTDQPVGSSDWAVEYGLKDAIQCDGVGCENDAELWCTVSCCTEILLACADCMENAHKIMSYMASRKLIVTCKKCNARNSARNWLGTPFQL
jgi:hypothetical protein